MKRSRKAVATKEAESRVMNPVATARDEQTCGDRGSEVLSRGSARSIESGEVIEVDVLDAFSSERRGKGTLRNIRSSPFMFC